MNFVVVIVALDPRPGLCSLYDLGVGSTGLVSEVLEVDTPALTCHQPTRRPRATKSIRQKMP